MIIAIKLSHGGFKKQLVACFAPSHYLNQDWVSSIIRTGWTCKILIESSGRPWTPLMIDTSYIFISIYQNLFQYTNVNTL